EIVVSFKYTEIKKINPVVFVFQDTLGFGFYNVRGIPLKKEAYEEITELPGGMFKCNINAKIGILNAKLNEIVPMQFDEVEKFDDTLFIVKLLGKYGIYNANKGMLVQPNYERIKILDASKSLMLVKKLKELQICKFSGIKHISLSFEYSQRLFDLISFYQNTSVFSQKGKFGILDANGKVVLKPQYEEMGKTNSLTPFKLNNQWGFLNQTTVKVNPMYDACYTPNKLGYVVEKNGKQGVIDYNGKEIISLQYNSVKWLKEGYYILDLNGLLGLANEFGTIIVPCGNKSIQAKNSDLFLLQNSNEIRYFIPSKSLWIKAQDE
ncbi:MAG: WG repeat-containing protein, partial [Crocinitomicaceae bacterium]